MDRTRVNIGILTSSRADYGIYLPLLHALQNDGFFNLEIIVFGTHLSRFHGYTKEDIVQDGFRIGSEISSLLISDRPQDIATAHGLTVEKFSDFWATKQSSYDLVFALGDRFEMNAAVLAGIPLNIPFAHIHGGETTLGAIDNIYRHQITLTSKIHFPSTTQYAERIADIVGSEENIFPVGALSLDKLSTINWESKELFCDKFDINPNFPFGLVTVHPETVAHEENEQYIKSTVAAIEDTDHDLQWVITMPNADTSGSIIRTHWLRLKEQLPQKVVLIENFGAENYFMAMKYASYLLGNTSSGIIEAASFNKYVINLGNRQKGRVTGENVYHIPFEKALITKAIDKVYSKGEFQGSNPYDLGGATSKIIQHLKSYIQYGE